MLNIHAGTMCTMGKKQETNNSETNLMFLYRKKIHDKKRTTSAIFNKKEHMIVKAINHETFISPQQAKTE